MPKINYTVKREFFNKEEFRKNIYEKYIWNFNAETGDKLKAFYQSTDLGLFKETINLIETYAPSKNKRKLLDYYGSILFNFENKEILKEISKLENQKVLIPDFYFN